jgi:hypothetical protein
LEKNRRKDKDCNAEEKNSKGAKGEKRGGKEEHTRKR